MGCGTRDGALGAHGCGYRVRVGSLILSGDFPDELVRDLGVGGLVLFLYLFAHLQAKVTQPTLGGRRDTPALRPVNGGQAHGRVSRCWAPTGHKK